MIADALFRSRDWIATVPAVLVLSVLLSASLKQLVKLKDDESVLSVSLFEEEAPPPPVPQPPQPRAQAEPVKQAQARPEPRPEPVDMRAMEPAAAPREVIPPPPPREAAPPPPSPVPQREAPPPTVSAPSLESAYVGRLRAYLEGIKRYPTSRDARSQRPQGKVRVWLELARDGQLRDSGVEQSSGSMILDGAAMSTVRQGNYPAIPAEAFAGRATQRFTVTLDYQLEGG